jgi:hypothetical protein
MSHGSAPGPGRFAATTLVVGFPSCAFIRQVELLPVCSPLGRSRKNNDLSSRAKTAPLQFPSPVLGRGQSHFLWPSSGVLALQRIKVVLHFRSYLLFG